MFAIAASRASTPPRIVDAFDNQTISHARRIDPRRSTSTRTLRALIDVRRQAARSPVIAERIDRLRRYRVDGVASDQLMT